jgi:hypothetical protein
MRGALFRLTHYQAAGSLYPWERVGERAKRETPPSRRLTSSRGGFRHRRALRSSRWQVTGGGIRKRSLSRSRIPENLTREFHKVDRRGRILVDTGCNDYSATLAAAYTVRARPGAPVSAPCTWEEVERGEVSPTSFTIRNMPQRIAHLGHLWSDLLKTKRSLRMPLERLIRML